MQIECVFFGPFRETVGEKTVTRDTDAETVGELLTGLEANHPDLDGDLLEGDGLSKEVVVTLNRKSITLLEGLETPLEDGDTVRVTPPVYGG